MARSKFITETLSKVQSEDNLLDFIEESFKIERILREPTEAEIEAHKVFLALDEITVEDLTTFVAVLQPNATLRDKPYLNVTVGGHRPIQGGVQVVETLNTLLKSIKSTDGSYLKTSEQAWRVHTWYETLHPFMDCNGRSGRVLWLWMMGIYYPTRLGFLHTWYYQTLSNAQGK